MKTIHCIVVLALAASLSSCKKGAGFGNCAAVCEDYFSGPAVTVIDLNNVPVALDSFIVTDMNNVPLPVGITGPGGTGEPVYGFPSAGYEGKYSVINDAWVEGHQKMTMEVRAKGWKDGVQLFDQEYTVGADCCHVYKKAGPDTIAVDLSDTN